MRYSGFHRAIAILHREVKNCWQIHLCNEIETEQIDRLRERYKSLGIDPPSYTAIVVKAIALGIREVSAKFPEINSMLTSVLGWKKIHTFDRISGAVGISLEEDGQDRVAPGVIEDADKASLTDITQRLEEFSSKPMRDIKHYKNCFYLYHLPRIVQEVMLWIGRTFPSAWFQYRGTFALTSVGKFGVDYQVTLPQAACLQFGFGVVRKRPVVKNNEVVAAKTFFLTLSFDRRLMNGKPCAVLMERIREILNCCELGDRPEVNL